MRAVRFLIPLSLLGFVVAAPARAQDVVLPPCVSDWGCGGVRSPLGFYIDTVTDDGRYITLEDGTIWEVQIDHRARAAGWTSEHFVEIRRIHAPNRDYEWLFIKGADREWRVAVRLVGRVRR